MAGAAEVNPACIYCTEPVLPTDKRAEITNAIAHWECGLRAVLGGLNHQQGRCSCCGGTEPPDPPGMTHRQAALAAVRYYYETGGGRRWTYVRPDENE
jgi:hypothetical protein